MKRKSSMKKLPVLLFLITSFIIIGWYVARGGGDSSSGESSNAIWTGSQEQVLLQVGSGEMAWNCEYTYAGQIFWRIFKGSCPGSIDPQ